jgi:L-threonylcarbamoyladenylate synthase
VIAAATPEAIARAAQLLREGALVAFPTETVYGLGADARNPDALRLLYAVKGRPGQHPVIVHIARASSAEQWASRIPPFAHALAQAFWPGPLTLILPCGRSVPRQLSGGQDSIGLRVPAHPVAQALLTRFAQLGGDGIAAPSANRFGRISATLATHVADEFGADVALVLDGGACEHGIESTIVDCTGEAPALLRPGAIAVEQFTRVLGHAPKSASPDAPRASGSLELHYAPRTPSRLLARDDLIWQLARLPAARVAVLAHSVPRPHTFPGMWCAGPLRSGDYAHTLYANLRLLDASRSDEIWIEAPPQHDEWAAINDRLRRATHRS